VVGVLTAVIVLVIGCSAPAPAVRTGEIQSVPQQPPARTAKVLNLASQREPTAFHNDLTASNESAGGLTLVKQIPHNYLVVLTDQFTWVPQLAAEQLSVERGTWRVNADGTMETTWKLRPNIKWHDGTPFTADDLVFSFGVYQDPEVPNRARSTVRLMQSVTAPDPLTLVVQWRETYAFANQARGLEPMPRHALEESYESDKANLIASPRFRSDYIGLGPYRLTKWEQGAYLEFSRFDDYYLGRPPLDTITVKFIPDVNAMVANILSGAIDVIVDVSLDIDAAVDVRERWAGTGNSVVFGSSGSVRWLDVQHRLEFARPVSGLPNRTVRQAFSHATDRAALVDVMTHGFGQPADSWIHPANELRPEVEDAIQKYRYDPARAQQLLAEAAWLRGPDGVLVHQPSAERFEIELRATEAGDAERFLNVVGDGWKGVGAAVAFYQIPSALTSNNEFRTKFPGVAHISPAIDTLLSSYFNSRFNATAENRWTGSRAGYVNPHQDALSDRLAVAIEPRQRVAAMRDLLQETTTNLPIIPLYWGVDPVLVTKGVKGVRGRDAWNLFEWDKE
jgi:peptide/nickel transport system substrate-binding protein